MKNLIFLSLVGLLLLGCKSEPERTDFIINGSAKNMYNGIRTYLKVKDDNGREKVIDTAIIFNEKFTFKGKVQHPTLSSISVNSVNGTLNFMLENSAITVAIDKANIAKSTITGSKAQSGYEIYQKEITALRNDERDLKVVLRNNRNFQTGSKNDSVNKLLNATEEKLKAYPINYIKTNSDSYYSLTLINQESNNRNANIKDYVEAFESLDSNLKASPNGIAVKNKLDGLYAVYQRNAQLEIGKVAPNFEAPTPEGTLVSLNDLKGKVTIIDFWAAWCGPCRRENPNVVKVYNQYHSQGLEIIGVSLDGARTQSNPKQSWLDAIKKDQLTWTQVSSLKYFNDPVAHLYNISAIPATFILDADGKIVAKNLRGAALERKVQELLK